MNNLSSYKYRHFKECIENGEKIPRKIKKELLGIKLNKNKLRRKINKLEVKVNVWSNGYRVHYVEDEFCPKCGCKEYSSTGEMASYPETWVQHHCLRCDNLVAEADNSAMVHSLVYIVEGDEY